MMFTQSVRAISIRTRARISLARVHRPPGHLRPCRAHLLEQQSSLLRRRSERMRVRRVQLPIASGDGSECVDVSRPGVQSG
eukprot:6949413-Prymnesium_polylepis.1